MQRVDVIVVSVDEDRQGTGPGLQREAVQGARGPLTRIRIPPHAWTVTARLDVLTPAQRAGVNDRARYRASPMRAGRWWCVVSRAWARPCCWTTWPGARQGGAGRATGRRSLPNSTEPCREHLQPPVEVVWHLLRKQGLLGFHEQRGNDRVTGIPQMLTGGPAR